jgi:hypothetical protein
VKFGTCLPVAEVICGRGNTCDAAERDSRNSMRMPFGADLTGGHFTAIPSQDNNEIALGRTARFREENNLGFENKNRKATHSGWPLMPFSADDWPLGGR